MYISVYPYQRWKLAFYQLLLRAKTVIVPVQSFSQKLLIYCPFNVTIDKNLKHIGNTAISTCLIEERGWKRDYKWKPVQLHKPCAFEMLCLFDSLEFVKGDLDFDWKLSHEHCCCFKWNIRFLKEYYVVEEYWVFFPKCWFHCSSVDTTLYCRA